MKLNPILKARLKTYDTVCAEGYKLEKPALGHVKVWHHTGKYLSIHTEEKKYFDGIVWVKLRDQYPDKTIWEVFSDKSALRQFMTAYGEWFVYIEDQDYNDIFPQELFEI